MYRRVSLGLVFGLCIAAAPSGATPERAAAAFQSGDFAAAEALYTELAAAQPTNASVLEGLARLRLYDGRIQDAEALLMRAEALGPADDLAKSLRAQIDARRKADAAFAQVLDAGSVAVPFVALDPLPAVEARVNGKSALLIVDTGGPALMLDPDFARTAGIEFGKGATGTFAGGRQAAMFSGSAATFELGSLYCRALAFMTLPAGGMQLYPGKHVDGVLGMGLLRHFLATIDYPKQRLLFQPQGAAAPADGVVASVRMWLAGEGFVFARARVNDAPEATFFINTGLAGGGVMLTKEAIDDAHITLNAAASTQGTGGGGPVVIEPFVAHTVALGAAAQHDVPGTYTPGGSALVIFPFAAAGLISHDFFKPYAVTFDFTKMQLVLSR
jgi:tetratricopeptide (TPR) repeat protein